MENTVLRLFALLVVCACVQTVFGQDEGPPSYCKPQQRPQTFTLPKKNKNFPFPKTEFAKVFSTQDRKWRMYIKREFRMLKTHIRMEEDEESTLYPLCVYNRQCAVRRIIVRYVLLPFEGDETKCWIIQPIIWTRCAKGAAPDFQCGCQNTGIGYSCVQDYRRENVWVYCEDGVIRVKQVVVPSGCSARRYSCDASTTPELTCEQ